MALVLLAISPAAAEAQDWCPPPILTLDSIYSRVEAVVAGTLSFGEVSTAYQVQTVAGHREELLGLPSRPSHAPRVSSKSRPLALYTPGHILSPPEQTANTLQRRPDP